MAPSRPPFREPTYFVLASLLDGRLHGYGIIKHAGALSGGRVRLTAGTLYGAVDRLIAEGLVAADGEEVVSGRRRRYYRLTGQGESAIAAEAERLGQAADLVRSRMRSSRLRESPA